MLSPSCTECAARSLAYDFRSAPYDKSSSLLDESREPRGQTGRCGDVATDISYSAICTLSGGKVIDDEHTRRCTVDTMREDIPTVVAPELFRADSLNPLHAASARNALAPGALAEANKFCKAIGDKEYSYPVDFCLSTPYHVRR